MWQGSSSAGRLGRTRAHIERPTQFVPHLPLPRDLNQVHAKPRLTHCQPARRSGKRRLFKLWHRLAPADPPQAAAVAAMGRTHGGQWSGGKHRVAGGKSKRVLAAGADTAPAAHLREGHVLCSAARALSGSPACTRLRRSAISSFCSGLTRMWDTCTQRDEHSGWCGALQWRSAVLFSFFCVFLWAQTSLLPPLDVE